MSKFAEPMSRLIDELKKLPGVGAKSAQRLAFHILRSSDEDAEALAAAVRDVKANLRLCSVCNNITDVDPCVYCTSATRNQRLVCVVEEPTNIAAIEKTKHFNGVFHVLHGAISPLHGIGPEQLRISNLITRVDAGNVDEVIVATNPTVEGEATATYLSQQLKRAGRESHPHRHGHPRRQRHRIHRRNHDAESNGRPERYVERVNNEGSNFNRLTPWRRQIEGERQAREKDWIPLGQSPTLPAKCRDCTPPCGSSTSKSR